MDTPKFSLIMPAYNSIKYIKAAIDSVKAQTYKNWELIIQDDCSTDGTYELAVGIATLGLLKQDFRIKVFKNDKNVGTVNNRANAMKNTTGEFIGHLDNDDLLYPYSLEVMVQHFQSNPDVALAFSDMADIDVNGNVFGYRANPNPEPNLAKFGWKHFGAYRRSAYEQTEGYNRTLPSACEDGDLFMQIADKMKFSRIPIVLYQYRSHDKNASRNNLKCESCPARTTTCNFAKIWAKHTNFDLQTWKPK